MLILLSLVVDWGMMPMPLLQICPALYTGFSNSLHALCFFFMSQLKFLLVYDAKLSDLIKTGFALCTYNAELVIVAVLRAHLFLESLV